MGGVRYFAILILTIIAFVGTTKLMAGAVDMLFIKELYLLFFLLIISGISLIAINRQKIFGWAIYTLIFLVFMFNAMFLYLQTTSHKIFLYAVLLAGAFGFVISIAHIRHRRRQGGVPRLEIEDIYEEPEPEPEKKQVKKAPAKKAKKRKKKKKAAKKTKKRVNRRKAA